MPAQPFSICFLIPSLSSLRLLANTYFLKPPVLCFIVWWNRSLAARRTALRAVTPLPLSRKGEFYNLWVPTLTFERKCVSMFYEHGFRFCCFLPGVVELRVFVNLVLLPGVRISYVFYRCFVQFHVMPFALLPRAQCLQTLTAHIGITAMLLSRNSDP